MFIRKNQPELAKRHIGREGLGESCDWGAGRRKQAVPTREQSALDLLECIMPSGKIPREEADVQQQPAEAANGNERSGGGEDGNVCRCLGAEPASHCRSMFASPFRLDIPGVGKSLGEIRVQHVQQPQDLIPHGLIFRNQCHADADDAVQDTSPADQLEPPSRVPRAAGAVIAEVAASIARGTACLDAQDGF